MTIKIKLILSFLSIAIIPVLVVQLLSIYQSKTAIEVAQISKLEAIADLKANKIEIFLSEREADIETAQHDYNIKTNLPILTRLAHDREHPDYLKAKKMLDGQLKAFQEFYGFVYVDVMLVNPEGQIVYVTNDAHADLDLDRPLPDPDGKAFQNGKKNIYFSDIFVNKVEGIPYGMLVTAPVIDFEGKFSGVLALEMNMNSLYQSIQESTGLGETGETVIAKKMGDTALFLNPLRHDHEAVLSRSVAMGGGKGLPIQEAVLGREGSGLSIDYRGQAVISAWRHIPALDWGMVAKIDTREAFNPIVQLKKQLALFVGILLLLVMFLGFALAASIARPIMALQKGVKIIGGGNLEHKVATQAPDEIGQLSRAFDEMTDNLTNLSSARDTLTQDIMASNQSLEKEIGDRKRAEEAAKQSEAMMNSIIATATDAIITIDARGIVGIFNRAAEHIFGYGEKEVIGQNIKILMPSPYREEHDGYLSKYMKSGKSKIICLERETIGKRKDGSTFPMNLAVSKVDLDDRIIFTGIVRDITGRKKSEKEQRQAATVFNACTESITITDPHGNILSVNPAFTRVTGYSADEVIGKNPKVLQSGRHDEAFYKSMWDTISATGHWQGEIWNKRKNGEVYEEMLSITEVKDKQGEVLQYIALFTDISEQKHAAAELDHLNASLQIVNEKLLEEMAGREKMETELRLAQKLEAVGQLAAGIAHEINTPMQYLGDNVHFLKTAFDDYSELIEKYQGACAALGQVSGHETVLDEVKEAEEMADLDYLKDHLPTSFERTFEGIERVSTIIKAMKDFSHPDQREKASTDLNQALSNTLTVAKNEYKYVADIETAFGDLPLVSCHVGEINQVFLNLIVNAAHAIGNVVKDTQEKGQIHIRTELENENTVLISVQDTGSGIPADIRERVFDPFFTTKKVGSGTGQGLAISRSAIVDKHGGSLTLESAVGQGTTFFVRLPIDGQSITKAKEDDA